MGNFLSFKESDRNKTSLNESTYITHLLRDRKAVGKRYRINVKIVTSACSDSPVCLSLEG